MRCVITTLFEGYFSVLYLIFVVVFIKRKQYSNLVNLLSASAFGVTLEFLSILIFDTYTYSSKFFFQIGYPPNNVPIIIGLSWGMIIISSMHISDQVGIQSRYRPFLDALQALTLDFAMDVTAIRLDGGFWNWGFPMTSSVSGVDYFGVPWGNYIGWYFIVLIYSYFIRYSHYLWGNRVNLKVIMFNILTPIVAYLPLYVFLEVARQLHFYFVATFNFYGFTLVEVLFLLLLAIFIVTRELLRDYSPVKGTNFLYFSLFLSFHLFYLIAFILSGLFVIIPFAGFISIIACVVDMILHYKIR